nr:reverse transcriptase domain-containing protein [Tanacetum cinerariifolium]
FSPKENHDENSLNSGGEYQGMNPSSGKEDNSETCKWNKQQMNGGNTLTASGHFKVSEIPRTGGSILGLIYEVVKVGQVMGYKMEGCMTNIADIIEAQGADEGSFSKQEENLRKNLNDDMRSILEPDVLKTLPKPNIPYPSRLNDQKLHEKSMNQMEKFFQIFQDLHFDISFTDALLLMPKFASTIKSLLANKDKDVCHALAVLDASINLMPLSIWKKLSLPELTPTQMTLELADRSITRPKGVVEDVFVKMGKFHFPTDFVVVDIEADPCVSLILGRSFLRTSRALIDVYGEEITLYVNDEAVIFNINQTTRYSSTYDDMSVNRIDVIDVSREEYAQEMLSFSKNSSGGNPTLTFEPIIFDSSPSLTLFEGSDFILEEIEAYLQDELILPEIDHADCDSDGNICLIENLLNDDPFQLPPMDLKQGEVSKAKSLIEEPLKLELKDLPLHLEYAYLEGEDKLPIDNLIISITL